MYILGISCFYHDAAAALIRDGVARGRRRGGALQPAQARLRGSPAGPIDFCLEQAGIAAGELDYVVFYEKPLVKFERILTPPCSLPALAAELRRGHDRLARREAVDQGVIRRQLGVSRREQRALHRAPHSPTRPAPSSARRSRKRPC